MPLLFQTSYTIWSVLSKEFIIVITSSYIACILKKIKDDDLLYISEETRYLDCYVVSHCIFCWVLFHCIANLAKSICLENPSLPEHFMSISYGLSTRFSKANQSDCETEPNFLSAVLSGRLFHAKYNFPSHIFHRIVPGVKGRPKFYFLFKIGDKLFSFHFPHLWTCWCQA